MTPKLLPLITGTRHGSRSHMTCHFKCGNACDQPIPNESANPAMADIVASAVARRSILKGSAVGAGALVMGGLTATAAAASTPAETDAGFGAGGRASGDVSRAAFTSVAPNNLDNVTTAPEFTHNVIIRWGDPVEADAPRFDVNNQTPESQSKQLGYNCDYVGVLPLDGRRALLVNNHEYTDEYLMFPTGAYDPETIKKIAIQSHGMAVVAIERGAKKGSWIRSDHRKSSYNRRITGTTEFHLDGPAAGHAWLQTAADPTGTVVLGTFGNCSGGTTPWGTVLSGEENFNGYFDASAAVDPTYAKTFKRYGLSGAGKGWSTVDERFDLARNPHEAFRFGWIVEIDPYSPDDAPVKHTMLGRFKHEGANVTISESGHAVAYMGDDERGDYIYKFVSRDTYRDDSSPASRRHNKSLLTAGTLYVARFTGDGEADGVHDGTGQWLPLTSDSESFVAGMTVAEVLINTRLAADTVTPTKMDRPEDIEPNPVNGKIYCALTNNSDRGVKYPTAESAPLASSMTRPALGAPLVSKAGNRNGYILEVTEDGGDHTGTTFAWDLMLVCGDPAAPETYFAGYDKTKVSPISCPDNVAFDAVGNLWISTDGAVLGGHDGLYRVPVAGPERGKVECFLTMPIGAETCGPLVSEDQLSVFFAVQHPGETDTTFEAPSSTWPHTDGFPRPSIGVAYRK